MGIFARSSWVFSLTNSSLVFPVPLEAYLGLVYMMVKTISTDSLTLKVKSALESRPKTYGESVCGIVAMYSMYLLIYKPGFAGILYLKAFLSLPSPAKYTYSFTFSIPSLMYSYPKVANNSLSKSSVILPPYST